MTIANDVYDGDTTTNGNFDLNVAGIGQAAAAPQTTATTSVWAQWLTLHKQ
ncbi:MAG: hypothetical protein IPL78_03685 [Chloroflexi bacterium]|nr:hypothetical protein [Chloroflexota bacterium]